MEYDNYLKKMRIIQKMILEYIDKEPNSESDFPNLIKFFDEQKIKEDPHILKETLHLILNISTNHHRTAFFFTKIDKILLFFKESIIKNFYNYEIFTIFRKNFRLVFFLLNEGILKPDISIFCFLTNKTYQQVYYPHYFTPEFKQLFQERDKLITHLNKPNLIPRHPPSKEHNSKSFENKRKIGENDSNVCGYIRKDNAEEFATYTKNHNLAISMQTHSSIFETNAFLINRNPTLIEYAAFMGSINIFKYLIDNGIKLTPSLWLYAIHSKNMEIIHILEEKKIQPEDETFEECLFESIKCHHFEMTDYILNTIMKNQNRNKDGLISKSFKFSNYNYFPDEMGVDFNLFYELCKNDYHIIVEMFLSAGISLNSTKVLYFFLI